MTQSKGLKISKNVDNICDLQTHLPINFTSTIYFNDANKFD